MKPYYEHAGITIYHGDCREVLPHVEAGAVVTDPPYGQNLDTDYRRFSRKDRTRPTSSFYQRIAGDDSEFDPSPWLTFQRVVLFGFNHFSAQVPTGTLLVWIKKTDGQFGTFLSDCEVAWMKGGSGVYARRCLGKDPRKHKRQHPTEKPVPIMRWCIEKACKETDVILDPYMGSGTTLVAAKNLGRSAIGIEIEEHYCEIAAERLSQDILPGINAGA